MIQRLFQILPLLFFGGWAAWGAAARKPPEIIPLEEIRPGMKGVWKTAVKGTEITSFDLEVLGIVENFAGPRQAVIICRALDQESIRNGPVGGMSGSPVYLGGRLAGAYAYGFAWAKEQTIIGVQPIEHMLELLRHYPIEPPGQRPLARRARPFGKKPPEGGWAVTAGGPRLSQIEPLLKPLPAPLIASGFSDETRRAFQPETGRLGLSLLQGPGGTAAPGKTFDLSPGAPVAAVLMTGDFTVAATGTVTCREGDSLLAFGHALFQHGQVAIPMAGAEIVTIVRALNLSFKLSNIGPVAGGFYQDRLTAVGGKVGRSPPMTEIAIRTTSATGDNRTYRGELFEHPRISPLFAGMALLETLLATMEAGERQTFFVDGAVEVEGFEPLPVRHTAAGPAEAIAAAHAFYENLLDLTDNPFARPRVTRIRLTVERRHEWQLSALAEARLESPRSRPGETAEIVLALRHYQDKTTTRRVRIPLPETLVKGDEVTILVADAATAGETDALADQPVGSLAGIVEQWRRRRPPDAIYIKLMKKAPRLLVEGADLPQLPPSVLSHYTSPRNLRNRRRLAETTLWETVIPAGGIFEGAARLSLTLE